MFSLLVWDLSGECPLWLVAVALQPPQFGNFLSERHPFPAAFAPGGAAQFLARRVSWQAGQPEGLERE
jgi:hypothetical protein